MKEPGDCHDDATIGFAIRVGTNRKTWFIVRGRKYSLDKKANAADAGRTRTGGAANCNRLQRASAVAVTPVPTATAIPAATTKQQDEQNNDQDRFHEESPLSETDNVLSSAGFHESGLRPY
jgi:hypothetical protein